MSNARGDWKKPNHYSFRNQDQFFSIDIPLECKTNFRLHSERLDRCNTYRTNRRYSAPLKHISNGIFWDVRRQFWNNEGDRDEYDADDDETLAGTVNTAEFSVPRLSAVGSGSTPGARFYVPPWRPELGKTNQPIPLSCYPHKKPSDRKKVKNKPSRVWDECVTPEIKQRRRDARQESVKTSRRNTGDVGQTKRSNTDGQNTKTSRRNTGELNIKSSKRIMGEQSAITSRRNTGEQSVITSRRNMGEQSAITSRRNTIEQAVKMSRRNTRAEVRKTSGWNEIVKTIKSNNTADNRKQSEDKDSSRLLLQKRLTVESSELKTSEGKNLQDEELDQRKSKHRKSENLQSTNSRKSIPSTLDPGPVFTNTKALKPLFVNEALLNVQEPT